MKCGHTNLARFSLISVKPGLPSRHDRIFFRAVVFFLVRSHVNIRHIFVVDGAAILGRLWIDRACVPLSAALKHTKKPNGQTLDDTPLNMGPPGDRTRHMSTERTEDFSWIVDLSWHGMQQGESEVVTTEEKKRKKTSAANTSKLQTRKGEILFS